jgi:ubiquinone/menaquinone biosynthesis C-methylase UbiE
MKEYYERRAPEYDRTSYEEDPPPEDFLRELEDVQRLLTRFPPTLMLDVACGTGYLTQQLSGDVYAVDQSRAMLEIARLRLPGADLVQSDALALPFRDSAFDTLFAAHIYGHLEPQQAVDFLAEARRVARRLVVIDSAAEDGTPRAGWEERTLSDGSRHTIYKRFFTPEVLLYELGGGTSLFSGRWFVAVSSASKQST